MLIEPTYSTSGNHGELNHYKATAKATHNKNQIKATNERLKISKIEAQKILKYTYTNKQPEMIFFSDSKIDNLTKHDEWKQYPVIMNECTGFDEVRTPEDTDATFHTHWCHIFPIMKDHKDKEWILIHTSWGVSNEIIDKYQKIMDDEGINGYIWKTKIKINDDILPKES